MNCLEPIIFKSNLPVPCRKCAGCMKRRVLEWGNRMVLESHGQGYKPLFITLTYAPEYEPGEHSEALHMTQLFYKSLRNDGFQFRYFNALERGTTGTKRLHNHMILWSKDLYRMYFKTRSAYIRHRWGRGRVDVQDLRTKAGLIYTAKYVTKDFAPKNGRQYQFSNRPQLGTPGIERWGELILSTGVDYTRENPPPN